MAGYDGRGARFNIVAVEGNDLSFTVTAVDDAAAAINLSAATITATIYNAAGTVVDQLSDSVGGAGSNIITLSLTDTEVDALTAPHSWALVVTRSGDARTWLAGSFAVADAARARNGTSGTAVTATVDTDVTVTATALAGAEAANVNITDSGAYYTGTTVEAALAEIANGTTLDSRYSSVGGLGWSGQEHRPKDSTVITTFQSGHGWSLAGSGSSGADDTSDYVIGSQSYRITTGTGGVAVTFRKTGMTSIDATGKVFRVWLKVSDLGALSTSDGNITLYVGDGTFTNFWILGLNTAGVQTLLQDGEWLPLSAGWQVISTTGSPNRAAITDIQLRVAPLNGVAAVVRVNCIELIDEPATAFPNGVVSLTFDDGYASQLTRGATKMSQVGFRGTAFPIPGLIGTGNYLTTAQLRELHDVHGWDVGAHSFTSDGHTGGGFTDMTAAELDADLRASKSWLVDNGFRGRDHLAYPLSSWNSTVALAVRRYYKSARLNGSSSRETYPPTSADRIRAVNIGSSESIGTLQTLIDGAYANRWWLVFTIHDIVASGASGSTQMNKTTFDALIDDLVTTGIPVLTVDEVMSNAAG